MTPNPGTGWSEEELGACIEEYKDMLAAERLGTPYSKAAARRRLLAGPCEGRSHGSLEFRFCNISAVLSRGGHEYVAGYKPMGHVGRKVEALILELLT